MVSPLVSALRPLATFGLQSAAVTVFESAASGDREGMDELSEEVRALFSMRDAEPKVFPATLAFNVLPLEEGALREEVAEGLSRLGLSPELRVSRALVPTFSAESAFVEAVVDDPAPNLDTVIDGFRHARGVTYAGDELGAVDALGRDDALVGRVRAAPHRIAFYVAADRLRRGSATLAALALERWISV
jgi:aspartate-semialdehyde dehydrogenase